MFFKQKVRNLLKSKEIRVVLDNLISLSALKVFNLLLPFVTLPYLIRILGFDYYGAIFLGLSLIAYFQTFTDYGFNLSTTREIAKNRNDQYALNYIYSKTLWSKVVLLGISLVLLIITVYCIPQLREHSTVYLLMSLMLMGSSLFPEWFFRGVEQMRYIMVLDLLVKIAFTVGVFIFIRAKEDYWLYPLLYGMGYIFIALFSHYLIFTKFLVRLHRVSILDIKVTLQEGFPLFINQFMPNFYNNTTGFLIGISLGNTEAGIFGAVKQVVIIFNVFNSVVSTVVFPYLVRNQEKFYAYSRCYIVFFVILATLVYGFHHWFFRLIGIIGDNVSEVFLILIVGVVGVVIYHTYATNYLIARGYEKTVMKITISISLLGLLAVYPLIKAFGLVGGAINVAMCQIFMGIIAFFSYRKIEMKKNSIATRVTI